MRGASIVLLALLPAVAHGWDSRCYVFDPCGETAHEGCAEEGELVPCDPGPEAARSRWRGPFDEHRQIFDRACQMLGLPRATAEDFTLRAWAADEEVPGTAFESVLPVPLDEAERIRERTTSVAEFAQLPDFAYGLWDWSAGNERCPFDEPDDPVLCHDYARHMGPVNSSHFLPQAAGFYAHYHGLALDRAGACAEMGATLAPALGRFDVYLRACEKQALVLEAIAQHYLQDSWSSGHMWERWGGPDIEDFRVDGEIKHGRAALAALTAGMVHGSRAVMQEEYARVAGLDVDWNDAMCAPHDEVEYLGDAGAVPMVGDQYLHQVVDGELPTQYGQLFSCAVTSLWEVYQAAGMQHGEVDAPALAGDVVLLDDVDADCFGQRATNTAIDRGAGLDFRIGSGAGVQIHLALYDLVTRWGVTASTIGIVEGENIGFPLTDEEKAQYRVDVGHFAWRARMLALVRPEGTSAGTDDVPDLVGVGRNSQYEADPPYLDPALPWGEDHDDEHGRWLARVFHRAHADDWCRTTTVDQLERLRSRVDDDGDGQARAAACDVCTEFAARHLRVGDAESWDVSAEPLCAWLVDDPALIYQPAAGEADVTSLARAWCDCDEAVALLRRGPSEGMVRLGVAGDAIEWLPVAGAPEGIVQTGASPRDFAISAWNGPRAVVSNGGADTVSILSLERGFEHEVDVDDDLDTMTPGAPVGVSRLVVGDAPRGVAVSPGGLYALVAVGGTDELVVIDLDDLSICERIDVGRDAGALEHPEDVAVLRDGSKAYVSLVGTNQAPGDAVAIVSLPAATDCEVGGDEVTGYLEDLGGRPRPGALALSPDGARLAIALRGTERVAVIDTATDTVVDLRDEPERRFFLAAQFPWALAWAPDGAHLYYGHVGGVDGSRLGGLGTVRRGRMDTGHPGYDVGVQGAVRTLAVDADDAFVYVGDALGYVTVLPVELWDGAPEHIQPPYEGTGGCLSERGYAVACPAAVQLPGQVQAIQLF